MADDSFRRFTSQTYPASRETRTAFLNDPCDATAIAHIEAKAAHKLAEAAERVTGDKTVADKMTVATATRLLATAGILLRSTGHGEYRVNRKGGIESEAYYTDNITDAVATGLRMAKVYKPD